MIDEKWTIKRILWFSLGMLSLGMAYIGVVTPGIPFSIFLVIAAYSFARSSKKWHDWIYNHKYFVYLFSDDQLLTIMNSVNWSVMYPGLNRSNDSRVSALPRYCK